MTVWMFTGSTPNRFRINRPDPRLRINWIRRPDHVRITSGSHTGGTSDHVRTCRPPRTTGSTPDQLRITSGSRPDHASGSRPDHRMTSDHVGEHVGSTSGLNVRMSSPECHFESPIAIHFRITSGFVTSTCKTVTMPFSSPRTPPSQEHRQTPGA
jgi:hypothetical protein